MQTNWTNFYKMTGLNDLKILESTLNDWVSLNSIYREFKKFQHPFVNLCMSHLNLVESA